MSYDLFNSLTQTDWSNILNDSDQVSFGFYLEDHDNNDITTSNPNISVSIQGSNKIKEIGFSSTDTTQKELNEFEISDGIVYINENEVGSFNNIFYVDYQNGDNTNGNGTKEKPFKTLDKAVYSLKTNNDAIVLKSGTHILSNEITWDDYEPTFIGEKNTLLETGVGYFRPGNNINTIDFYNLKITSDFRFMVYSNPHSMTLNFYNSYLHRKSETVSGGIAPFFYNYSYHWNIYLYNSYMLIENDFFRSSLADVYLYNSILEGSHISGEGVDIYLIETSIKHTDVNYKNTVDNIDLPVELNNTGTGLNPDESNAHIGVRGGKYGWGKW